jgi:hypothetical protein
MENIPIALTATLPIINSAHWYYALCFECGCCFVEVEYIVVVVSMMNTCMLDLDLDYGFWKL